METIEGQGVGMREMIATLVVSGLLLITGIVVFAKVKAAMPAVSGDANTTINTVESTAYDAFELSTVALIVLAAAVIIGILISAFGA
jgi:ABC-type multidrug transport system permease subunit